MTKYDFEQLCAEQGYNSAQISELSNAIEHGLNIRPMLNVKFSAECIHEIVLGMLHHVDINLYAKEGIDAEEMRYLRLGLEAGCQMTKYATGEYSARQLECIYTGFMRGIDVTLYDNPDFSDEKVYQCYNGLLNYPNDFEQLDLLEFNEMQLYQLNEACKKQLPIADVADPAYNDQQMQQLISGLSSGIDVTQIQKVEYNADQMKQIRLGLEKGIDVNMYASNKFTAFQMKQIRLGLEQDLDVALYAEDDYSGKVMLLARLGMLEGIEVNEYLKPGISDTQAQAIYDRLMELQTSIDYSETDYTVSDAYLSLVGLSSGESLLQNDSMSIGIKEPEVHAVKDTSDDTAFDNLPDRQPAETAQEASQEPEPRSSQDVVATLTGRDDQELEDIPEPADGIREPGEATPSAEIETDFSECITPPLDAREIMQDYNPRQIEL